MDLGDAETARSVADRHRLVPSCPRSDFVGCRQTATDSTNEISKTYVGVSQTVRLSVPCWRQPSVQGSSMLLSSKLLVVDLHNISKAWHAPCFAELTGLQIARMRLQASRHEDSESAIASTITGNPVPVDRLLRGQPQRIGIPAHFWRFLEFRPLPSVTRLV